MLRILPCLRCIAVLFGLAFPVLIAAEDDNWSDSDNAIVNQGDDLLDQGKTEAADRLYRQLMVIHPESAVPLVLHVMALNAMGRYPEALAESRKAVALDPENSAAQKWLGVFLCRTGQPAQAIAPLRQSLELDHYYNDAAIWLASAYVQTGQPGQSSQILEKVLQDLPPDKLPATMAWIASVYYDIGDSPSALLWWQRAAQLGSKSAAQWLSWAYSTGYGGVPIDEGHSAYWSRIGDDPFPWLPRLSFANDLVQWTHGWFVVLVLLASAACLPLPTIGIVALCVGRGVTTDPALHWTERARRSYPFQVFLGTSVLLLPLVYAAATGYFPSFVVPVPKWLLFWLVLAVGLLSSNRVVVLWARRYHEHPGSHAQNLLNIAVIVYIYLPVLLIFGVMANYLPSQWGLQAALDLAAAVLAYFWIQFGGWVRLGRIVRLLVPGDPKLVQLAQELASHWQRPAPTVWTFRWNKANAFALPFANAIAVTQKLNAILSAEEMKAILAHEMAHLCEDRTTRLLRLLTPLLLLPLFTLSLWWSGNWAEFVACYLIVIAGFVLLRKRRRRMEERADTFGSQAQEDAQVYARSLSKLYETNHVPAVMPGKRMVHPHLYDRLLAAGITPDYTRPKPPSRWGAVPALLTLALNVVCLTTLWLLLF